MNILEAELTKRLEPMIELAWNLNFERQCKHVSVYFKSFPERGYKNHKPEINYIIFFKNGFSQKKNSCTTNFIEMIDCISDSMYKQVVETKH